MANALNLPPVDVKHEMRIDLTPKRHVKMSASITECRDCAHCPNKRELVNLIIAGSTLTPKEEYVARFTTAAMGEMKTIFVPRRSASTHA